MNPLEQQLLNETVGRAGTQLCLRTRTKVDTGRWWRRSPVWLCVSGDELLILAVARRRHLERIAIADCSESHYNHGTGELVVGPGESIHLNHFKMSPGDALTILKLLLPESPKQLTHQ